MKVLAKWKTYTMALLAGVLFTVATTTSDNQTDVSTEGIKQITQKPTIMILGSGHLANPGMDGFNYKMDDVLAPKRQREPVVQLLKPYLKIRSVSVAILTLRR